MYSFPERLGLFTTIEASVLSIVAVTFILCLAVYKWLSRTVLSWRRTRMRSPDASDSSLFLNLMFADLIQATGNLPDIRWMADGFITEDGLCTAQAALKQFGIVGVSMTSLAIAIHTFTVLVLRWRAPRSISRLTIVGIWAFAGIVIGIPVAIHRHQDYYGANGYWCWIKDDFEAEQIVTEYLWVWTAGLIMLILYTIMFVVIRGWFIVDNGVYWYKNYKPSYPNVEDMETEEEKQTKAIANLMLFYPAIYIFCFLPNTISRWRLFGHLNTPYQFALFASTLYALSGTFNVAIFFITRPELVVGPSVTVESEDFPLHQKDLSNRSSHNLGHLPDRSSNNLPTGREWNSGQPDFDPMTLTSHGVHSSPLGYNVAPLPGHNTGAKYLSNIQDPRRSRESSSLIDEEEDYGHLP